MDCFVLLYSPIFKVVPPYLKSCNFLIHGSKSNTLDRASLLSGLGSSHPLTLLKPNAMTKNIKFYIIHKPSTSFIIYSSAVCSAIKVRYFQLFSWMSILNSKFLTIFVLSNWQKSPKYSDEHIHLLSHIVFILGSSIK